MVFILIISSSTRLEFVRCCRYFWGHALQLQFFCLVIIIYTFVIIDIQFRREFDNHLFNSGTVKRHKNDLHSLPFETFLQECKNP